MSNQNKLLILVFTLFLVIVYAFKIKQEDTENTENPENNKPVEQIIEEKPIKKPLSVEPTFESWPKVRDIQNIQILSLGEVLQDIELHMPAGHGYRDSHKVTWAHETTHGINANIRNARNVYNSQKKIKEVVNGFIV
jgi:hypothetical protein